MIDEVSYISTSMSNKSQINRISSHTNTNRLFINIIVLLIVSGTVSAQADHLGSAIEIPAHPRILMLKGEEDIIKRTISGDSTWYKVQQAILDESDTLLSKAPVERIKIGRRLLDKSREALRRLFFLSYAYRMTTQEKYLKRAEKELLAISAFSDWNPDHFLDVAEMTMAVSIGYDWLYNNLSRKSRTIIKEAILKKGIEPSLDTQYNSWLTAEHNWNQVCNAGMTYGALAIYEDHPKLAKQIINRAINTIVLAMKDYGPNGAYPEGYGYWGYGTSFNVMLISALEKDFGKDFGLSEQHGFLNTARYLENMTGPSGNPFNYSDAGQRGELQPAMFWFATKLKDPSLLWVERSHLIKDDPKKFVEDRLLPAIMLWSNGISIDRIAAPATEVWVGRGKNPVALMRTSWTDSAAIWVGMKGGSVSVNHAHMDIGSFVMEADGVRWAMDFGMQDYESLESKGIELFGRTQDAQRWTIFRYTNEAHNTLMINNRQQLVTGYAPIISSTSNPSFMSATTDMSSIYKNVVEKAKRGVAVVDKSYVIVDDEIETLSNETKIRWTMLTPADVKISGSNEAELTKNGKKLLLQVQTPLHVTMKKWSTDPPHNYDAPNPGTTLVGFEATLPANSSTAITVALVPGGAENKASQSIPKLESWGK